MWILEKPLLETAIQDIDNIISNSNGVITEVDKIYINYLYRLYNHSNGSITLNDNNRCRYLVQNKLYSMYDTLTYGGKNLYYIREELFKPVKNCPMCGFGEPSQLDHQMPRSVYKSLSLCRLNLVPTCSVCNNKKNNKDYSRFVHPYYAQFPNGVIFLVVNIHIDERTHVTSWKYALELNGLSQDLADKVKYQVSEINLLNRLQRESNNYLSDLFGGLRFSSDTALKEFLRDKMNDSLSRYKINDWRSALLRALYNSSKFKKEEAHELSNRRRPLNNGANV